MTVPLHCEAPAEGENGASKPIAGKEDALRRLSAAGVDPIIPRFDCIVALNLSPPTIARMQKRRELPPFAEISPGRKGWRRSTLIEALNGRRTWSEVKADGPSLAGTT